MAEMRRGCVQATRCTPQAMRYLHGRGAAAGVTKAKHAERRAHDCAYWGSCVDLPQPVSPATTRTLDAESMRMMLSRLSAMGSACKSVGGGASSAKVLSYLLRCADIDSFLQALLLIEVLEKVQRVPAQDVLQKYSEGRA
jgi:hypothetical protein